MDRCGHHARCYIQSLPSGPNHNSNGLADGISYVALYHGTFRMSMIAYIALHDYYMDLAQRSDLLNVSCSAPSYQRMTE
jgi:hypothetical protein